jgi:hypothetical protein
MYKVRTALLALLLPLVATTARGQAPLPPEQARELHKLSEEGQRVVQNAQNSQPVAPNAVKDMHDMNPAPALWVIYETSTWVALFGVLVVLTLALVAAIRWYQRHAAPADPVQLAMSDPWVRANLGRLNAPQQEPEPPASEAAQ